MTKAEIEGAVSETLNDLCLEKVADQPASTLSGGEMRRVSLGIELVMRPQIILANELTSSRDIHNAEVVIELCLRIAKMRKISILVTIHQPNNSVTSMLEKRIVMHKGMCVYEGRTSSIKDSLLKKDYLLPYGPYNVLDWILRISQMETNESLAS